jgi:hypothetical protein
MKAAMIEQNESAYTGCRKINVFQVRGLLGKNLWNLEKIKNING